MSCISTAYSTADLRKGITQETTNRPCHTRKVELSEPRVETRRSSVTAL